MRTPANIVVPVLVLTGALAACSSSSSSGGSVTGSVDSTSFSAASTIAVVTAADTETDCNMGPDGGQEKCTSSSSGQAVIVILTNRAAATCAAAVAAETSHDNLSFANMDSLEIFVANDKGNLAPGAYTVIDETSKQPSNATSGAAANFSTSNSACKSGNPVESTGGTVTLTQISATSVQGTYSIEFGSHGSFSGSFDVPVCDLPDGGSFVTVGDAGAATCTP
jgi:hypothetical protein